MSFAQVIEELPRFTAAERQELLRNVLELDDEVLSDSELALVEQRLAAYQADTASAVAAETMAERIRARFSSWIGTLSFSPSFIPIWRRPGNGMSKSSKDSGRGLPVRFWMFGLIWRSIPCSVVKNIPAEISVGDIRQNFPTRSSTQSKKRQKLSWSLP